MTMNIKALVGSGTAVVLIGGGFALGIALVGSSHPAPAKQIVVKQVDVTADVPAVADPVPSSSAATVVVTTAAVPVAVPTTEAPKVTAPINTDTDVFVPPNNAVNPGEAPPVRQPRQPGPTCVNAVTGEAC